ncbi:MULTISPECIES: helix-turn-helix domain-containing protein [unclassified Psychrobacillus]|uniref:helix-turn-helix domain-containing protein n=1 Tax=unclassified Psychrobacillus TaxID=2636677 RepID=UPI0012460EB6|nr:helix-turn-helix transcriptional regulator [Psychrobacillus sp. AK 1817]QEY20744.1 XRE family transcriptional regulator [Psychrobacillus sp. AK 1817]QGM31273.1 helix-turn-helix domain-containing protein [Bacillus sp. N3536]
MAFYEHLRAYREQLDITQMEAARRIGIDHSVLSKYEKGDLAIPIDLLMKIKEVYAISNDDFLNMLEDKPSKSKNPGLEARESRSKYIEAFQEEYVTPLASYKEFRLLVMDIKSVSKEEKELKRYIKGLLKKD